MDRQNRQSRRRGRNCGVGYGPRHGESLTRLGTHFLKKWRSAAASFVCGLAARPLGLAAAIYGFIYDHPEIPQRERVRLDMYRLNIVLQQCGRLSCGSGAAAAA